MSLFKLCLIFVQLFSFCDTSRIIKIEGIFIQIHKVEFDYLGPANKAIYSILIGYSPERNSNVLLSDSFKDKFSCKPLHFLFLLTMDVSLINRISIESFLKEKAQSKIQNLQLLIDNSFIFYKNRFTMDYMQEVSEQTGRTDSKSFKKTFLLNLNLDENFLYNLNFKVLLEEIERGFHLKIEFENSIKPSLVQGSLNYYPLREDDLNMIRNFAEKIPLFSEDKNQCDLKIFCVSLLFLSILLLISVSLFRNALG